MQQSPVPQLFPGRILYRRAAPSSDAGSSSPSPSDANVALVAIIASVSFVLLLMLVCVYRTLRRHPAQPGCFNWFIGRSSTSQGQTGPGSPRDAESAAAGGGTSPRRLSVIQDEITHEYYRRSAIMAVAGPRVGPAGLTTSWDPSKPPSEIYTPPPPYLPDQLDLAQQGTEELLAASSSAALPAALTLPLPASPAVASSSRHVDLDATPTSSSRRTRPQTIDDVLGLPASSPDFRAVDPPPPAYAPFSDIPLVEMVDEDDVPIAHAAGIGTAPYLAGHAQFARQHDQSTFGPGTPRQHRGPASEIPTRL